MDTAASVLLSFPPDVPSTSNEEYHGAAVGHVKRLAKLLQDYSAVFDAHGSPLLELLDPSKQTISYVMVLAYLISNSARSSTSDEKLLDRMVEVLCSADSRQVRYVGSAFSSLIDRVAGGQLLPHLTAVNVLVRAIFRIDPTGTMLTSHHLSLVNLAYQTYHIQPAFDVIDRHIVYYPGMCNARDSKLLSDMSLPPNAYISKESGLTLPLKPDNLLQYDLICGLMYCSARRWPEALAAFERAVTYPTKDGGTGSIMAEAHKKWLLVSLLVNGRSPTIPSATGSAARKSYETLSKPYLALASHFNKPRDAVALKGDAEAGAQVWSSDGNFNLVREVMAAHQKWQIIGLRDVYSKISIADIRAKTVSAETGESLESDDDAEALINGMIQSGMLKGTIEKPAGKPSYLTFLSADEELTEEEFSREILAAADKIKSLEPIFKATSERLGTNKDYIKHLVKEQRREKDRDTRDVTLGGFDIQVEDEDLMGDPTSRH